MRQLRAAFGLLVLLLAANAPAAAQQATATPDPRRALADRVVAAIYEQPVASRIMDVFWPVAIEVIRERVPDVNDVQLFLYRGKTETLAATAARVGLVPLADMFARGFSETELADIAAFYESPAGAKLNGAQGTIGAVLSGAAGDALKGAVNTLRREVDDMLAADGY